jgi:tetratricopeptide (TPR) repeat protein
MLLTINVCPAAHNNTVPSNFVGPSSGTTSSANTNNVFSSNYAATSGLPNQEAPSNCTMPATLTFEKFGLGERIQTKTTITLSAVDYFEGIPLNEIIQYPICTLALFGYKSRDGIPLQDIAYGPGLYKYFRTNTNMSVHLHPQARTPMDKDPEYFLIYRTRRKLSYRSLGTYNPENTQLELLQICLKEDFHSNNLRAIGDFYRRQNNFTDALHWFKKSFQSIRSTHVPDGGAIISLVDSYMAKHRINDQAKQSGEQKLAVTTQLLAFLNKLDITAEQLCTVGSSYFRNRNFNHAVSWFKRALLLEPEKHLFMNLMLAYQHNGQLTKVIATGKKALALHLEDKQCGLILNNMGYAYERLEGQNSLACAYYMQAYYQHLDARVYTLVNILSLYSRDKESCSILPEEDARDLAKRLLKLSTQVIPDLIAFRDKFPHRYNAAIEIAEQLARPVKSSGIGQRYNNPSGDKQTDCIIA